VRVLAVIAARGGSKRLPGKNIRILGGKPLIAWSVEVAKGVPELCDVLVSTDDVEIARVARTAGAIVPWLRPEALATDTASSLDVCMHSLDRYEAEKGGVDGILLLQPTSPFRRRETILKGIELFKRNPRRPVIGVSPAESHPLWCFRLEQNALRPFLSTGGLEVRSQDLPPAYVINGAFYLIAPDILRQRRSFFSDDMAPLIMEAPEERIDIDSEWDWILAETMLAARRKAGEFMRNVD